MSPAEFISALGAEKAKLAEAAGAIGLSLNDSIFF